MVKIRLQLKGRSHQVFYWIIVIDSRFKRQSSNFIEKVGTYNPYSKELKLDYDSFQDWVKKGAQPTQTVKNIFKKNFPLSAQNLSS